MNNQPFQNPFRPGAGHPPPYLAGREKEKQEFKKLLKQTIILENLVLTGLRGVGKTVLLDTLKPISIRDSWLWVGTDVSEAVSVSEKNLAIRLITDLSSLTSNIRIAEREIRNIGFVHSTERVENRLDYTFLVYIFENTPGLVSDKLKFVLEFVWKHVKFSNSSIKGIVLAYDEAQNLSDQAGKDEHPLSILLDVFQSIQKKEIPIMLVLTGLPTLFPKLVAARTFAERMFTVLTLTKLDRDSSREAINKPIDDKKSPVEFTEHGVNQIIELSAGYPYFIQFICREAFDLIIQTIESEKELVVQFDGIIRKLDTDFFAGRWNKTTDRQRELLRVVSVLPNCDDEFTVQEIVEMSQMAPGKAFGNSHVNQLLKQLADAGLVYKTRFGNYSFAVPLLGQFISRLEHGRSNI
ncbi:MAG: ATP-binding protein [Pyrinomonadaceae bacterium]